MTQDVYLAGAVRTPIGTFCGMFEQTPAPVLGSVAVKAALQRSGVPAERVDEVIFGNVIGAGDAPGGSQFDAMPLPVVEGQRQHVDDDVAHALPLQRVTAGAGAALPCSGGGSRPRGRSSMMAIIASAISSWRRIDASRRPSVICCNGPAT